MIKKGMLVIQLTLCNPTDCGLPDSSVHGILEARILERVAFPFSRGPSWPRDQTWVSHIAGRFFTVWATRETQVGYNYQKKKVISEWIFAPSVFYFQIHYFSYLTAWGKLLFLVFTYCYSYWENMRCLWKISQNAISSHIHFPGVGPRKAWIFLRL